MSSQDDCKHILDQIKKAEELRLHGAMQLVEAQKRAKEDADRQRIEVEARVKIDIANRMIKDLESRLPEALQSERQRAKDEAYKQLADKHFEVAKILTDMQHQQAEKKVVSAPEKNMQTLDMKASVSDMGATTVAIGLAALAGAAAQKLEEARKAEQATKDEQTKKDRANAEHAKKVEGHDKQVRALEVESKIRAETETRIKAMEALQADRIKEQARQLSEKYKDDPSKQQEMLAKLEQSKVNLRVDTDKLALRERGLDEQRVHDALKREGLLAAKEQNDREARTRQDEQQREAARRAQEATERARLAQEAAERASRSR